MPLSSRPGSSARYRGLAAIPLVLIACACAESVEPDPTPARDGGPYNMIDPVPTPVPTAANSPTEGDWRRSEVDGRVAIVFASADKAPLFRMHCDRRGGIILDRLQQEPAGDVERMEIRSGDSVTRLAVNELGTQTPTVRSAIPYPHNLLARLRIPHGMLSVKAGDGPPLVLPLNEVTAAFASECEKPDQSGAA